MESIEGIGLKGGPGESGKFAVSEPCVCQHLGKEEVTVLTDLVLSPDLVTGKLCIGGPGHSVFSRDLRAFRQCEGSS